MIKFNDTDITLKLGSSAVTAAYLGTTLVYSGGTPPTPTGDCIDIEDGLYVMIDPNFDTSLPVYGMDFSELQNLPTYEDGEAHGSTDIYDENGNYLGGVNGNFYENSQEGDIEVTDDSGIQIYTADTLTVDLCQLFGGPVYINTDFIASIDYCSNEECTEYECLEWDEESGECIDYDWDNCLNSECTEYQTIYVSCAIVENDAIPDGGEPNTPPD